MIECTRKIEFDAGHRVVGHNKKCQYIHGHRYGLEVTIVTKELDALGMVIDFGILKDIINNWINENFDHTLILHKSDAELGEEIAKWTGQKIYYMENNPTAENIALHLKNDIMPILFTDPSYKITKVKLHETPNCYVEVK